MAKDDSYPEYILNGVQSYRWVKPAFPTESPIYDRTDITCSAQDCQKGICSTFYCSMDGCPPTTKPFYALTETGDLYVTTPNGVIWYLANDSKEMKLAYPINKEVTIPGDDTISNNSTGITPVSVGAYGIQIDINNNPEKTDTIVQYTQPHIYPWRPGSSACSSSLVTTGVNAGEINQFIIGDSLGRKVDARPKSLSGNITGAHLVLPYCNGYYCVQTGLNRGVVFYKGEEIYDGEYSSYGLSAPFGYGLAVCRSVSGCNPTVTKSDIVWSYSLLPEWNKLDGHYVVTTPYDEFVCSHKIKDSQGKIIGSNILMRVEDSDGRFVRFVSLDGYYADDTTCEQVWETLEERHRTSWGEKEKYAGMHDFIKRRYEQYETGPEVHPCDEHQHRFDIYEIDPTTSTGLGENIGYVVVYVEGEIKNIDNEELQAIIEQKQQIHEYVNGLREERKRAEEQYEALKQSNPTSEHIQDLEYDIEAYKKEIHDNLVKLSELEDKEAELRGPEEQEDNIGVTGEFRIVRLDNQTLYDKINDNMRRYRVWWSPKTQDKYGDSYLDECLGVPSYACSYKALFRCNEEDGWKYRPAIEGEPTPTTPPAHYYWYVGNGATEGRADANFYMSRWREEICVSCDLTAQNDGGMPCLCEDYDRNGYTSDNNCLFRYHETQNPNVCGKCNYPVHFSIKGAEEPCWRHVISCPPASREPDDKQNYKLAHFCKGEIGRVELEHLGGRIHPIYYSDGTESDWAYVTKGEPSCRTKKDYTIIGEIREPSELPGLYDYNQSTKKTIKQPVDISGANGVILRAPSSECNEVEIDGKKVCEGDYITTSIVGFPKAEDYLIRRTITNKKTKALRCFKISEIDPIHGFKNWSIDGKGFSESENPDNFDISTIGERPCTQDQLIELRDVPIVVENKETGEKETVETDFMVPPNAYGDGRDGYIQVEITAVEKTVKKEVIKDTQTITDTTGTTTYTWSLNEYGKEEKGVSYTLYGRSYVYGDFPFWGHYASYGVASFGMSNSYGSPNDDGGYGGVARYVFEKVTGREDSVGVVKYGDGGYWVNQNPDTVSLPGYVYFNETAAGKVGHLFDIQVDADIEYWRYGSSDKFRTNVLWYSDLDVSNDEGYTIHCRYFSHGFTWAAGLSDADRDSYRWGFDGLPLYAGEEYGECVHGLYDQFNRSRFSGGWLNRKFLKTEITVTTYDNHGNPRASDIYTTEPVETSTESSQLTWVSTDGRALLKWNTKDKVGVGDSGYVNGVTTYTYDDITNGKKLSEEKEDSLVSFVLHIQDDCRYAYGEEKGYPSNVHYSHIEGQSWLFSTITQKMKLTGDFTVVYQPEPAVSDGKVRKEDSDPKEVLYQFLRFYPAYLTRPDYYFKLNDAETKASTNSEQDFIEQLRNWKKETNAKMGDDNTVDLPSSSPKATCTYRNYVFTCSYADSFYNYEKVDYDPITDSVPRRPDYVKSDTWRFVGYAHNGENEDSANRNGDAEWYAKWQLINEPEIIVKVPFPKPQGRCFYQTVRHLTKERDLHQGAWYCTGPAGSEEDALSNFLGSEQEVIDDGDTTVQSSEQDPEQGNSDDESKDELLLDHETVTVYDELSGIKWVQSVRIWGDPKGVAIRAGSQVGDIYYCTAKTDEMEEDIDKLGEQKTFEEFQEGADRYWYWNGFQWVDGDNYYSSLGSEKIIFYKDKGSLDVGVGETAQTVQGTSVESRCYASKAIFVGKASVKACGKILAVNLNTNGKEHEAIFYEEKPVFDRPAKSTPYTAADGSKMIESMACVCNAFVMATYSVGNNKQMFRLWSNAEESQSGYSAVFSYEDVPNLERWEEKDCDGKGAFSRDAEGNIRYPDYMVLHSRSGEKLYLFYKNKLIKIYQEGEWFKWNPGTDGGAISLANEPGSRGPRVAVIQTGSQSSGTCCVKVTMSITSNSSSGQLSSDILCAPCDIWLDGSLYRKADRCNVYGGGLSVVAYGDSTLAYTAGQADYVGYDIVQLTGLGRTFVVPHHMGISRPTGPARAGNSDTGSQIFIIPDTPELVGVTKTSSPTTPLNKNTDAIRSQWSFSVADFAGSNVAPIKSYNMWDVTMEEFHKMCWEECTYKTLCGCHSRIWKLVHYPHYFSHDKFNTSEGVSYPERKARMFYRYDGYSYKEPVPGDSEASQAIFWLWNKLKGEKLSDVYLLGANGAGLVRDDNGTDFVYDNNGDPVRFTYKESGVSIGSRSYPISYVFDTGVNATYLSDVMSGASDDNTPLSWDGCGHVQYDNLKYKAVLSDRTTVHDIHCTYYIVVLTHENKWAVVDSFSDPPALGIMAGDIAGGGLYNVGYYKGKLVEFAEQKGAKVGYQSQYMNPGPFDCDSNEYVTYGISDSGGLVEYAQNGRRFINCNIDECYDTDIFYDAHHDVAFAFHGSPVGSSYAAPLTGKNNDTYSIVLVYSVGDHGTKPYISLGALITGPTDDGTNIIQVIKTGICHGLGHPGAACLSDKSYVFAYDGIVEERGGTTRINQHSALNGNAHDRAFGSRGSYVFWQITGDTAVVLRLKDDKLVISNESVFSPCKEEEAKEKCGKYKIVVTRNEHKEGTPVSGLITTYTYSYLLFYEGYELEAEDDLENKDDVPGFAACCGNGSDYVIMTNGNVYYQETLLGRLAPLSDKCHYSLSCCGDAALITQSLHDDDGHQTKSKQLLLINGKPVAPFTNKSGDAGNNEGDRSALFQSAIWKTINVAEHEPLYMLSCCGKDYYLLQRGEYMRRHEPVIAWNEEKGTIPGKTPTYEFKYTIDMDPEQTYGFLDDGTKVILDDVQTYTYTDVYAHEEGSGEEGETQVVVDYYERYTFEYPLVWAICDKSAFYAEDGLPLTREEFLKKCGEEWDNIVYTEDGTVGSLYFYHDKNYKVIDVGSEPSKLHDIKETTARFVPWKTQTSMLDREAFVYYKTNLISTDPRIREIVCFRYENESSYNTPDYHAIAAYSIFYDDPFNECYESSLFTRTKKGPDNTNEVTQTVYTERTAVQNILGVARVHKGKNARERILVDITAPSMEKRYTDESSGRNTSNCTCLDNYDTDVSSDADRFDGSSVESSDCFCAGKGNMTAVYPNVCMVVWHRGKCVSRLGGENIRDVHKNDTPYIPFWDGTAEEGELARGIDGDKTIIDYRNDVIYINDLNAAGRWDRVSGDDPVDEWFINWPETTEIAGWGGFWTSAPDYHPQQDPGNKPLDPNGRLVVSGNNTVFVFDKVLGMLAFDILTGKRLRFK